MQGALTSVNRPYLHSSCTFLARFPVLTLRAEWGRMQLLSMLSYNTLFKGENLS